MQQLSAGIISFGLVVFLLPFVATVWLYGILLCKRMYQKLELSQPKGIEKAVKTYTSLTPEERMEIELATTEAKTEWVTTPKPEDEEKEMNERVFREGFTHKPPTTEITEHEEG